MVISAGGMLFDIQFLCETEASENELKNFAKTHRITLEESDIISQGFTIVDDPLPEKKDVERFLKVLKESGNWLTEIFDDPESVDSRILCIYHKEIRNNAFFS